MGVSVNLTYRKDSLDEYKAVAGEEVANHLSRWGIFGNL